MKNLKMKLFASAWVLSLGLLSNLANASLPTSISCGDPGLGYSVVTQDAGTKITLSDANNITSMAREFGLIALNDHTTQFSSIVFDITDGFVGDSDDPALVAGFKGHTAITFIKEDIAHTPVEVPVERLYFFSEHAKWTSAFGSSSQLSVRIELQRAQDPFTSIRYLDLQPTSIEPSPQCVF